MSNYNQTEIAGNSWQRCHTVQIANPISGLKSITFQEEIVYNIGGPQPLSTYCGNCGTYFDPEKTFEVLNTETGLGTGVYMTHYDLYKAIYSLYMHTAKLRDENNQK